MSRASYWHQRELDEEDRQLQVFEQQAAELDVKAQVTCTQYPFQIVGVIDSRTFYLRERWGIFVLYLSDAAHPGAFSGELFDFEHCAVLAEGQESELYGEGDDRFAAPLRLAVSAVRHALAREYEMLYGASQEQTP